MRTLSFPHQREVIGRQVLTAKKYLAKGVTLKEAARASGIDAATLDKYLLRTLGMKDADVARGDWLNIPA